MTGHERVLKVINREIPDRIPAGFYAMPCVQDRLMSHFQVNRYKDLLESLNADILDMRGVVDPVWRGPFPRNRIDKGVVSSYLGWRTIEVDTEYGKNRRASGRDARECYRS